MLFAADKEVSKYTVLFAASVVQIVASAIGILAGRLMSEYINETYLHYVSGVDFILAKKRLAAVPTLKNTSVTIYPAH